ncbi:MAG: 2-oxo acid dehydrogenase subunit E2 [Anaerolineae bacterium]|nr:2-oxo acid dehydrogenase subunit E2 [Anaerolineae bacterium]
MAVPVYMPKFGMTQSEATVVRWLRQEGDVVEQGDPLLEVETDKVLMEVEAPASGVLRGIRVQPKQVVPVASVIAYVVAPGEELAEEAVGVELPGAGRPVATEPPPQRATPLAEKRAAEAGIDISEVPQARLAGRVTRQDVEEYLAGRQSRVRATPAARRSARERGVELGLVAGSGPRGRIQQRDVLLASHRGAPPGEGGDEVVPYEGLRHRIGSRLQASYQTAPHITLTVEADMTAAERLRTELNALADQAGEPRVSVTAILVKVCAWALRRHRWVNASLQGAEIRLRRVVNVGVAVALDDGLIVPVIHNADRLGIGEISARLDDLARRAREGALTPDEVSGGTFTITNLGMFGVDRFTAIINPPESAILAVGRIAKRAVVAEGPTGDSVVVRPTVALTLSADHRVLDGAVAARFLQDVVRALESPAIVLW